MSSWARVNVVRSRRCLRWFAAKINTTIFSKRNQNYTLTFETVEEFLFQTTKQHKGSPKNQKKKIPISKVFLSLDVRFPFRIVTKYLKSFHNLFVITFFCVYWQGHSTTGTFLLGKTSAFKIVWCINIAILCLFVRFILVCHKMKASNLNEATDSTLEVNRTNIIKRINKSDSLRSQ